MKQLRTTEISFTFMGSFLGAGFVSGRELWQFFGQYGLWGFGGVLLAVLLLAVLGVVLFRLAKKTGIERMERIVIWKENRLMENLIGAVELSFLFSIFVAMASAAGALAEQLTSIPVLRILTSAVFCAAVGAVSLRGIGAMVKVLSRVVPLLVVLTLAISVLAAVRAEGNWQWGDAQQMHGTFAWILPAFTFVSYNFFCEIGFLASLGKRIPKFQSAFFGAFGGGALLGIASCAILVAIAAVSGASASELPMVTIAFGQNTVFGIAYAVLLLCAVFGAALSVFYPIPVFFERFQTVQKHRAGFVAMVSVAAWLGSLIGFSNVIEYVYPLYGYLAFGILICMVIHAIKVRYMEKKGEMK